MSYNDEMQRIRDLRTWISDTRRPKSERQQYIRELRPLEQKHGLESKGYNG